MRFAVILVLLTLAGCASTPRVAYVPPTATFRGVTSDEFRAEMIQRCVRNGATPTVNTESQLVCAKPMDDSMGSLMFRALATPQYSTNPLVQVRFNMAKMGSDLIVVTDFYYEFETAYGQKNVQPIQNGQSAADTQRTLDELKSKLEAAKATRTVDAPTPAQNPAPKQTAGQPPAASVVASTDGYLGAARAFAGQYSCSTDLKLESKEGDREVFTSACPSGPMKIECWSGICRQIF
jgi:hypothetical protein